MPIRFKCPHCARTLVTARRKAGAEIRCPLCGLPATVPADDLVGVPAGQVGPAANAGLSAQPSADRPLFETADVDAILGAGPALDFDAGPVARPTRRDDALGIHDEPEVVLTRRTAWLLAAGAVGAVVVAFVIGLKVGAAW